MATAKQKEVTTRQVASIQFGMYTDEEVSLDPTAPWHWQQSWVTACVLMASTAIHPCFVRIQHLSDMHGMNRSSMAEKMHNSSSSRCRSTLVGLMWSRVQVRKLSVQRITSPLTYDNLNNIVSGGLYDPAMGPVDQNARYDMHVCAWGGVGVGGI